MWSPLFSRQGSVAICRGCRRVYEGTASFAVGHAAECQHQRLYDALYRLERVYQADVGYTADARGAGPRAEVVFAILGEP